MLRYIFLSVFALLLLTACGGSDLDQAGGEEPVTDTSSKDLNKAFGNATGDTVTDKESGIDGKTQQKTEDMPKLDTGPINNEVDPITTEIGNDIAQFLSQSNPKSCSRCNLAGANLFDANLTRANLTNANLSGADLTGASWTMLSVLTSQVL